MIDPLLNLLEVDAQWSDLARYCAGSEEPFAEEGNKHGYQREETRGHGASKSQEPNITDWLYQPQKLSHQMRLLLLIGTNQSASTLSSLPAVTSIRSSAEPERRSETGLRNLVKIQMTSSS